MFSFCNLNHTLSYQSYHTLSYHMYQTLSYHVNPYQDTQHTSYRISIRIHFISICVYWNQFITHNWIVRKEWQTLPQILFQRVFHLVFIILEAARWGGRYHFNDLFCKKEFFIALQKLLSFLKRKVRYKTRKGAWTLVSCGSMDLSRSLEAVLYSLRQKMAAFLGNFCENVN